MAANFGNIATFTVPSKHGRHPVLQIPSTRWPGFVHEFLYQSATNNAAYYQCKNCKDAKRRIGVGLPAPRLTVSDEGIVLSDPDFPKNPHFCNPVPEAQARADKVIRDMRADIKRSGKRPLQAYQDGVKDIPNKFPRLAQADRAAVEQAIPDLRHVVSSLQRNKNTGTVRLCRLKKPYSSPRGLYMKHYNMSPNK